MGLFPSLKTVLFFLILMGAVSTGTLLATSSYVKSKLNPLFDKLEAEGFPVRTVVNTIVSIATLVFVFLGGLATVLFQYAGTF